MHSTRLVFAAWESAHSLVESVEKLEHCPGMVGKRFQYDKIADAAISVLAHVASSGGNEPREMIARLNYVSALGRARESLNVAKAQIESVAKRGLISEEQAMTLIEKCDELSAVLLLLSMEMRRGGYR